ncbi:ninjurin-1 [Scomber scombrus]|uniref:Ninjurin-1 n=1 Tax=Scomber scombrus TaxID=13677 RepID=A0AAV1PJX6_SCOSC
MAGVDRKNEEDLPLNTLGDIEAATAISGKPLRPININHYATKKSAAQSMLDVALLMANSSQLKTVLYVGPHYRFYIPVIVLLSLSIALQVTVGLLLVFIGNEVRSERHEETRQAQLDEQRSHGLSLLHGPRQHLHHSTRL